ncbi:hypothetical protein OV079_47720 [Nannocystis pusilla]|uniref:Uncharacterized protein n=1 Tax=Nannocystis pusilla TaxID=889268 RepID=A0A9X3EZA4_9BACT|nr:hypothetical protein [Nannocystis pusilla]MCY1013097.1 hypothetical protein [Nannocystis pusilla]
MQRETAVVVARRTGGQLGDSLEDQRRQALERLGVKRKVVAPTLRWIIAQLHESIVTMALVARRVR